MRNVKIPLFLRDFVVALRIVRRAERKVQRRRRGSSVEQSMLVERERLRSSLADVICSPFIGPTGITGKQRNNIIYRPRPFSNDRVRHYARTRGLLIGLHLHPSAVGKTRSWNSVSLQRASSRTATHTERERDDLTTLPLNSLTSQISLGQPRKRNE